MSLEGFLNFDENLLVGLMIHCHKSRCVFNQSLHVITVPFAFCTLLFITFRENKGKCQAAVPALASFLPHAPHGYCSVPWSHECVLCSCALLD